MIEYIAPGEIEARSFEIIGSEMDPERIQFYSPQELLVVKRAIHASADFDYQYNLIFQNHAMEAAFLALQKQAMIFTDTKMALAGINKSLTDVLDIDPECLISHTKTLEMAAKTGATRSRVSVDLAFEFFDTYNQERKEEGQKEVPLIFVVGNAPTALLRIQELLALGRKPAFVIAAPVGFVNVVEAKELILKTEIPAIVARGRKGGSNIAAALLNAILLQCRIPKA